MVCANVSDQNRIVDLDWLALLLEAEVGINRVDNPSIVQRILFCCQRGFLLGRDWRIDSWAQGLAGKVQSLAV